MGGLSMNRKNLIIAVSLTFTVFVMIALQNVHSDAYSNSKAQTINYAIGKLNNTTIKQDLKQATEQDTKQDSEQGLKQETSQDNKQDIKLDVIQGIKQDANQESESQLANSISKKIIRFHVIANSDSEEDQATKLEIRDAILKDLGTKLEQLKTREESIGFLKSRLTEIENIANEILAKDNKNYSSKAYLEEFQFPIKSYGEITLPQGKYTALRVVLGNGEGKNWWCVMFPPLCFIDITRGLASEESNKQLGKVLDKKELGKITNKKFKDNFSKAQKTSNNGKISNVQIRFKAVDFIKKLLQ
jgi:stage II sporulation protein R